MLTPAEEEARHTAITRTESLLSSSRNPLSRSFLVHEEPPPPRLEDLGMQQLRQRFINLQAADPPAHPLPLLGPDGRPVPGAHNGHIPVDPPSTRVSLLNNSPRQPSPERAAIPERLGMHLSRMHGESNMAWEEEQKEEDDSGLHTPPRRRFDTSPQIWRQQGPVLVRSRLWTNRVVDGEKVYFHAGFNEWRPFPQENEEKDDEQNGKKKNKLRRLGVKAIKTLKKRKDDDKHGVGGKGNPNISKPVQGSLRKIPARPY